MKRKLHILSILALISFTARSMQDSIHLGTFPKKTSPDDIDETRINKEIREQRNALMKLLIIHGPLVRKESGLAQRIFIYRNPSQFAGALLPAWGFCGSIDNPLT